MIKFMYEWKRLLYIINTTYHFFTSSKSPILVVVFSLPLLLTTTNNIYDFVCTHFNLYMNRTKNPLLSLSRYALSSQFIFVFFSLVSSWLRYYAIDILFLNIATDNNWLLDRHKVPTMARSEQYGHLSLTSR
jgi:hypothetical protein